VAVTSAAMLAVYAIVDGNEARFTSAQTIGLLGAASLVVALFIAWEAQARSPLVPLRLFRSRNLVTANVVGVLWAAAMFAWFFISALYLQRVAGYDALRVGLAFLPANLAMAACSLGLLAELPLEWCSLGLSAERSVPCGTPRPLVAGVAIAAAGLALFARAPLD